MHQFKGASAVLYLFLKNLSVSGGDKKNRAELVFSPAILPAPRDSSGPAGRL
jgi:hypothetical protein